MVKATERAAPQPRGEAEVSAAAEGMRAAEARSAADEAAAGRRELGNMGIWDRLKRTDPKATKPFTRLGGFRGTQIDPTWRLQMMTEAFGPVGIGWGYEQVEWTVVERMIFICVRVWYRDPLSGEKVWTGPQWGGTEIVRRNRDGTERPDDECFKMSMTDALGKCLLQIGLAADVYMGQFDDSKYREEAETYWTARQSPENQPAAVEAFEREIRTKLDEVSDIESLDGLWRSGVGIRLREIGVVDRAAQQRITQLFSQKKAELLREGSQDAA